MGQKLPPPGRAQLAMSVELPSRIKYIKSIGSYVATQGLAQLIGFATGIIVVRGMSKSDYAYYSVAVAIIAATAFLAEAGLNSALMSRGARVREDTSRLSTLFATGMKFRFFLGIPIILGGAGVVAWLLLSNGLAIAQTILCSLIVLLTLGASVTTGTIQTYHRLTLGFDLIKRTSLVISAVRFCILVALFVLSLLNVILALAVGLICAVVTNLILKRAARSKLDFAAPHSLEDRKAFRLSARRTLPMTLLLVASEQSILVFLSFLGTTEVIAEISALARFSIAFTMLNLVVMDIAAPMFARTEDNVSKLLRRFSSIMGIYVLLATVLIVFVALTAPMLLSILGANYSGLEMPLIIVASGSAILNVGYAFSAMNQAKGWTKYSSVYIPLIAVWAGFGLIAFDLSTTMGAALFMATQAVPSLITQFVRFAAGTWSLSRERRGRDGTQAAGNDM